MEPFDVVEHISFCSIQGSVSDVIGPLPFEHAEEAFACSIVTTVADGTHRAQQSVSSQQSLIVATSKLGVPYSSQQLRNRVARYAEFAGKYPQLLPDHLRAPDFIAWLDDEVVRVSERVEEIRHDLLSTSAHIALCHWNANVDNAWFWRDGAALRCGFMDWGCVGQMNVAMSLWGALSAAQTALWDQHLDPLLEGYAREFAATGTEPLHLPTLKRQLLLYAGWMGITWLLDAPACIER